MKGIRLAAYAAAILLSGCATVSMPPNVQVATRGDGAGPIRSIDFSFSGSHDMDFKRLKLCVAENVQYGSVTLKGGDQILATPWGILQHADSDTIPAGSVMRYADDDAQVLIAKGETEAGGDALKLVSYSAVYQLRASTNGHHVGLVFSQLKRAQKDSGSMANSGYMDVGTWPGGGAMDVYKAVQGVADEIRNCMN